MGRKSAKGKEKKQKRKEENAKMAVAQVKVDAANKQEDPMSTLQFFKKYERKGLNLTIECKRRRDVSDATVQWCFDLTKQNLQSIYEASDWGWKDKDKMEELQEDAAWYLLVRDESQAVIGYVHFRFDMDFDDEVLYCYELHLVKAMRRKGLGKFLMQILELMAHRNEMKKVILTVLKNNKEGISFYTNTMKYEEDETNLQGSIWEDDYCYMILSKLIKPPTKSKHSADGTAVVDGTTVTNGTAHTNGDTNGMTMHGDASATHTGVEVS